MIKGTRYVIQREDGMFYWKGNLSSDFGFTGNFNEVFLFLSERGARSRLQVLKNIYKMDVSIKRVTILLDE